MFIEASEYQRILEIMPIACIDFFIVYEDHVFLGKRTNVPYKGEWFVPGGRIQKGETQDVSLERKLFEETGIRIENIAKTYLLGVHDTQFVGNTFDATTLTHTINITYVIELKGKTEIVPDTQNEIFQAFSMSESNPHLLPYIQAMIAEYLHRKERSKRV